MSSYKLYHILWHNQSLLYVYQLLANYTGLQVAKANQVRQWKIKRNIQYIEETRGNKAVQDTKRCPPLYVNRGQKEKSVKDKGVVLCR